MGRIDFVRGLLSGALLLLFPTPGLSQNSNRSVVVSGRAGQSISVHELSMPEAARNLVAAGERKLSQDKNPAEAIKDFQSAIAKAHGYYEAYYLSGVAYLCLRKQDEAEKNLRKSIELSHEKYGDPMIALGAVLLDRNEFAVGEKLLRRGLQLNPNSWQAHYELSRLEVFRGNLSTALEMAQKARESAPQKAPIFHLLAVIHQRQEDYASLLDDLDDFIQLDPDSPTTAWAKQLRTQTQQQLAAPKTAVADVRK